MTEQQFDKHEHKKRSVLSRVGRFLLYSLASFFLLIGLLVTALLLYLTPQRIEHHIKPIVAKAVQSDLQFSIAHFNVFNGFIFKDISLQSRPDSKNISFPVKSLQAKQASLKYSFKPLLKKQLVINEVLIDKPQIELEISPVIEDTLQSRPAADSAIAPAALPISFKLERFRLQDADIVVDSQDSMTAQHIFLSEINLFMDQVSLPKGQVLDQDSLIKGQFSLQLNKSNVLFRQKSALDSMLFSGVLDAAFHLNINSLDDIIFDGAAQLQKIELHANDQKLLQTGETLPLSFALGGQFDLHQEAARIDSIVLRVQNVPWIKMCLHADSLLHRPYLHGRFFAGGVPVSQLIGLATEFAPELPMPDIYLHNPNAEISITGSEFSGNIPDSTDAKSKLSWTFQLGMGKLGATINRGESFIQNLDLVAKSSGSVGYNKIISPKFELDVNYDSLALTLPQVDKMYSGKMGLTFNTGLNEKLIPSFARVALSLHNFLGADIEAEMSASGGTSLQSIKGKGSLSINNFDLGQLPTSQALGTVSAKMEMQINTLDSLKATIFVLTDSLLLTSPQQSRPMQISPLSMNSTITASTDELFQHTQLHQLLVSVNHFFSAEMDASLRLNQEPSIQGHINQMSLDHAALFEWLPLEIKKPLAGFRINGKTNLTGLVNLSISGEDTSYSAAVQLVTSPTDLDFTFENLFVKNLRINSEAAVDSKTGGKLDFVLSIDSTLSTVTEPLTFLNNKIGLRMTMKDNFQSIYVDTGYVSLPDLKTFGFIAGSVSDLISNPQINARMEFHQAAKDTLVVTKDIRFKGENDIVCSVGTNQNTAHLDARVKAKDLSFFLPNKTRISRVNADISLSQKFDLQNMILLGSSQPIVKTPSEGLIDYFLYRNYYSDHINKSRISIRRVEMGEYQVENISLEAYLGNGRIEIPSFLFDVYGGNIGGQLTLAAGMDNIFDAEYKLSAHFSGINSALLLPTAKAGDRGIITAHAELQGRGIDVEQGIDLDGYFNITQIESKVADNLLRSLDPEGKDSGIRSTRILINRGFKPRLFQFEIRHSYCYPAVYFDQPWYFPVRLSGGGLELSRIPIAYFLNMNQPSSRSAE